MLCLLERWADKGTGREMAEMRLWESQKRQTPRQERLGSKHPNKQVETKVESRFKRQLNENRKNENREQKVGKGCVVSGTSWRMGNLRNFAAKFRFLGILSASRQIGHF